MPPCEFTVRLTFQVTVTLLARLLYLIWLGTLYQYRVLVQDTLNLKGQFDWRVKDVRGMLPEHIAAASDAPLDYLTGK
jgi:hypothetical protein